MLASTGDEAAKHLEEPFAAAPFVHPFRHPSYHATQLRAINFAKATSSRLHWTVAYDKMKVSNHTGDAETKELRKERWLEFHDRFTSGIPGLLPLVLNLPLRFTESLRRAEREMGIFKHTRGILRGWEIEDAEAERLNAVTHPEVVFNRRPLKLYIEVPTATSKLAKTKGEKIFTLRVQQKQWSLDKEGNVKIARFGFPVVPDFGGTAHAYCGSTLEASLGDLLPWYQKPQMADMLKAYIIKSRIRLAENLLLVQPYSPHLFRQGSNPGPQLLLDLLSGKTSEAHTKKEWKKIAKATEKQKSSPAQSWMETMTLPCRRCSDQSSDGEEVWKPLASFTMERNPDAIWNDVVSKGQDAMCFTCRADLGADDTHCGMCCEGCGVVKTNDRFSSEARKRWASLDRHSILCLSCENAPLKRSTAALIQCNGVGCKQLPEYHFLEEHLNQWKNKGTTVALQCARCYVRSKDFVGKKDPRTATFTCVGCDAKKPFVDGAPVTIKLWIQGKRQHETRRCFECQYPSCTKCQQRPLHAVPHNAMIDGKYFCETCRYPPCQNIRNGAVCGKRRVNAGGKHKFKPSE